MDQSKLNEAAALEAKAYALRKQAFDERPMPDFWRIGQKVRYLSDSDYAWNAGQIGIVKGFHDKDPEGAKPATEYQVFYTTPIDAYGIFWTTPHQVELVEDVDPPQK